MSLTLYLFFFTFGGLSQQEELLTFFLPVQLKNILLRTKIQLILNILFVLNIFIESQLLLYTKVATQPKSCEFSQLGISHEFLNNTEKSLVRLIVTPAVQISQEQNGNWLSTTRTN